MLNKYVITYVKFQHNDNTIVEIGANSELFNLKQSLIDQSIEEKLPFLTGMLPLQEEHLLIPSVEYAENKQMDVHLIRGSFEMRGYDWMLCHDRSEELHWQQLAQQKNNELLLLNADKVKQSDTIDYFDLYHAIAFEYCDDELFRQLVNTPQIFQNHFPSIFTAQHKIDLFEKFPFLENFIIDAKELWFGKGNKTTTVKSGPWMEQGKDGKELALEATAHCWQSKKLLTIELLDERYEQQLKILQMGREEALMRQQAEYANREKSKFLTTISHELRTPLNVVIGFTELCQEQSAKNPDFLEKILISSKNLLSLIDNILDFSKLEAGKLALESYDFDLVKEMLELESMFSYLAKEKGIQFKLSMETQVPHWVKGDPLRIKQVLMNLIANAVKFTHRGQVEVHICRDKKKNNQDYLKFTVKDSGIGISEKQQHKIFEAFVQADQSTSRKYGGTGLGLAICKNLVEQMGGEFQLQSQPEKGSIFTFTIPCINVKFLPPNETQRIDINNTTNDLKKGSELDCESALDELKIPAESSVLLVEDNQLNQDLVIELLKPYQIKLEIADNGLSGVAKAISRDFDCILMDLNMPIMDGYQASKIIRENAKGKVIPIIALTASDSVTEQQQSLQSGMDDIITKPIHSEQLVSKIAQWINVKQFQHNYKK